MLDRAGWYCCSEPRRIVSADAGRGRLTGETAVNCRGPDDCKTKRSSLSRPRSRPEALPAMYSSAFAWTCHEAPPLLLGSIVAGGWCSLSENLSGQVADAERKYERLERLIPC